MSVKWPLLVLATVFPVRLALASAGTDEASFLNIPVGARPAAMGNAYSALATDAYATVSNPGGLGFLTQTQVAAQHLSYLESIHYEYLAFVRPVGEKSAWGASVQYLGSGDMVRTDLQGQILGQFSSHYAAYALSFGQRVSDRLSLGVSAKFLEAALADVHANAFASDVGAFWKVSKAFSLASVLSNAGTHLRFIENDGNLPLTFKVGAAYQPEKYYAATVETQYLRSGLWSGHAGLEWRPMDLLSLRAGYRTDTRKELDVLAGFSTGMGLHLWGHEFSYAWLPYGDLGTTQYFSLVLRFGGEREERRNLISLPNNDGSRS